MSVDSRPFLTLVTAKGSIRCGRPKVNPLSAGLTGSPGQVTTDACTHTLKVYVALGIPPTDLKDNVRCTVDGQAFVVLKNGVSRGPGVWKLYLRSVAVAVPA